MQININFGRPQWALGVFSLAFMFAGLANATSPIKATPFASPLPHGFVTSVQKANGSGVVVSYRIDTNVIANQPTVVSLIFNSPKDIGTVTFSSDAGLQLSGISSVPIALPKGGSQLLLKATANMDGILYINVFTTAAGATSVISIPVKIGNTTPKIFTMGKARLMPNGDRIIAMPVP